jgi:hypothetical protein
MAWIPVENYSLGYSIPKKEFYCYYALVGEGTVHQIFPSPQEFIALADISGTKVP